MHLLLIYGYVDDIVERRAPYREAHLALLEGYVDRGEVVLGGAFANPVDGAAIVFKVENETTIEEFVANYSFGTVSTNQRGLIDAAGKPLGTSDETSRSYHTMFVDGFFAGNATSKGPSGQGIFRRLQVEYLGKCREYVHQLHLIVMTARGRFVTGQNKEQRNANELVV